MANEYTINQSDLTAVADAIRTKGGTSDVLRFPDGFVQAVGAISADAGGGNAEQLLYTAAITSPVSAVSIDVAADWKAFDALICVPDIVFSTTEYLCYYIAGTRNYIGNPVGSGSTAYTQKLAKMICTFTDDAAFITDSTGNYLQKEKSVITNISFAPYSPASKFTSGTLQIWGVNF